MHRSLLVSPEVTSDPNIRLRPHLHPLCVGHYLWADGISTGNFLPGETSSKRDVHSPEDTVPPADLARDSAGTWGGLRPWRLEKTVLLCFTLAGEEEQGP
ncbi:hypothetical protein ANANG_G00311460 [Anguilla anguilla]|uniref:Uncharacterized protein n=1 Tax=Anguilla anguilla TaxID=7936 RepID=A0A9D3LJE8_ANGAN|nr:hypothetical protein ANANG_G00311460 [Anguilla anguilla]